MAVLRSLYRSSSCFRSSLIGNRMFNDSVSRSSPTTTPFNRGTDCWGPFRLVMGNFRAFSQDVAPLPEIKDSKIKAVLKNFMAADWGELPNSLIQDALKVLSENSEDEEALKKAVRAVEAAKKREPTDSLIHDTLEVLSNESGNKYDKEALKNVFRAAEAAEEFIGTLDNFKMAIDDLVGLSGENVKPLPEHYSQALKTAYDRYSKYLDSFGPDEYYLKKKVEMELGRRMIHLKMRCGGLDSDWGKVTVLGTSGISGSYVEQRRH